VTATDCVRHSGQCNFSGQEPDRCPGCHTTLDALTRCSLSGSPCNVCRGTFEDHLRRHEEAWARAFIGAQKKQAKPGGAESALMALSGG
jgi:hypothetical protein